jgi:hypothetical protein
MLQDLIRNSNIRQHIYTSDSRVGLEVTKVIPVVRSPT